MDDKLTRKSQEALSVAIRKAAANGNPQVDPLHLLAALLEQSDGTAAPLVRAVGADPALIAKEAGDQIGRLPRMHGATASAPIVAMAWRSQGRPAAISCNPQAAMIEIPTLGR